MNKPHPNLKSTTRERESEAVAALTCWVVRPYADGKYVSRAMTDALSTALQGICEALPADLVVALPDVPMSLQLAAWWAQHNAAEETQRKDIEKEYKERRAEYE